MFNSTQIRRHLTQLLLTLVCFGGHAIAASYQGDVYSESVYTGDRSLFSTSTRARLDTKMGANFSPFLVLGEETQSLANTAFDFDSSSHGYGGGGVRFLLGNLTLSTEARYRLYLRPRPELAKYQPTVDFRGLVTYGTQFEFNPLFDLNSGLGVIPFIELYMECVFTSADSNNLIGAGFARLGLRHPFNNNLHLDLFWEPFLNFDTIGHFYDNHVDSRLTLRVQQGVGPITFGLSLSHAVTRYLGSDATMRGAPASLTTGLRGMFVMGAAL